MQTLSPPSVLVLGAGGRFGRCAVDAFSRAGWRVHAQSRSPLQATSPGVTAMTCDALDVEAILRECRGSTDVVVNGLNPVYTEWEARVASLADTAMHIARKTGALLMLPGNVYNFGTALPPVLTEASPQIPDTSKARIRIALEQSMAAAAAEGLRSVVIRSGDFLGGPGPGAWMDMVIAKDLGKGRVVYPGPLDAEHAWAYLPDLAQVFVAVAERRGQLAPFDVFHYAGLTTRGHELAAALEAVTGRRLDVHSMPWWQLRLVSPFAPMCRALLEMRYLWDRPHRLVQNKLVNLIGTVPQTGLKDAVRAALSSMASPQVIKARLVCDEATRTHSINR